MASFDLIVIAIVGFSLLIGLMRGFFHELLSLLSWGGALLIAWFCHPILAELLIEWLPNALLRDIAGGVIAFILAIIVLGMLANALSKIVNNLEIRSIDRALGGLYGIARGYVVACLLFAFAHWIWEDRAPPAFLNEGKTHSMVALGAKEITHLLASYEETPLVQRLRQITETGSTAYELHQNLINPKTEEAKNSAPEKGYQDNEREEFNDLFTQ